MWNNAKTLMSKYGDIICKQGVDFLLRRDIDNELVIGSYCYALAILHEVVAPLDLAFVVEISCLAHTLPAADAAQRKVGNVSTARICCPVRAMGMYIVHFIS